MKKFVAVILSTLYLAAASGATLTFHYCMGKFIGLDFSTETNYKCSNCGMVKKDQKGCCHDKQQTIQLKNDQVVSAISSVPIIKWQSPDNSFYYVSDTFIPRFEDQFCKPESPTRLSTIPIYLSNKVFRI